MMPITRRDLEILLDAPNQTDYIVSAYADLTVKDGFRHVADREIANLAREATTALSEGEARKVLKDNRDPILRAIETAEPGAKGLAVFSGSERGLFHTVPVSFRLDNKLVLDEEPYVLPLLEHWFGEPSYLVAVIDSHELHLFESYAGQAEYIGALVKDESQEFQRDKPHFTYKKRFANTWHEHLHKLTEDNFLKGVADIVAERFRENSFHGLILLGQAPTISAVRSLLPKDVAAAVAEEHAQAMTVRPDDVTDDVARAMNQWRASERQRILAELKQRWDQNHLIANGPQDVLDALQQGRAVSVIFGPNRSMPGGRCSSCRYRFGAPTETCPYCGGRARSVDAAQEIMRMALRQRITDVHLLGPPENREPDPLEKANGVAALLRAEADWSPRQKQT